MSDLEKQYQKMIETLENTIKDKEELSKARKQLDDMVAIVVDDCTNILEKCDKKIEAMALKNKNNEERISALEEKISYFEKIAELEEYDFFIRCPYCGIEFEIDYDDEIDEICCPACSQIFEIDWDEDEPNNNESN